MKKIETKNAPKAIGPYSQAVKAGDFLFMSGQIPIDPTTEKLIDETIESQTKQVLNNIEAILKSEGLSFENIVRSEIYLKDLEDRTIVNEIYAEKFQHEIKPARQMFQVSKLPLDAKIEITCIASY